MPYRPRALVVAGATTVALAILVPAIAGAEPGFSAATQMPSLFGARVIEPAPYGAISCTAATSCTAVGPSVITSAPGIAKATATTDSAGHWARVALPLPFGTQKSALGGVVCGDASDCTAVGVAETGSTGGLVETETSGTWSETTVQGPGGDQDIFTGLSCASQGNCVATGVYDNGGALGDMAAVETTGTWASATELPPVAIPGAEVIPYGIACQDTSDCTVIGLALTSTATLTVSWTETTGTWAAPVTLPTPGKLSFLGLALQCPTATTCLTVGAVTNSQGSLVRPASDVETSGTWSVPTQMPLPKLSPVVTTGEFTSLSCDPGICEAVGLFETHGLPATFGGAATWSGGTWSSMGLVTNVRVAGGSPANLAPDPRFDAVSCGSVGACIGVGTFGVPGKVPNGDFDTSINPVRTVTAPGAPEMVGGNPGVRRVTLSWRPPGNDGGAPVTSFTATLEPGGKSCTTGAYQCTIGGLVDGRQYVVLVSATNSAGRGAIGRGRFIDGGPPTTPHRFRVVAWSKSGVATLAWDPSVAPPGMRVTGYYLTVSVGRHVVRSLFTNKTTIQLGGLAAHHRYVLGLSASDLSGGSLAETLHVLVP